MKINYDDWRGIIRNGLWWFGVSLAAIALASFNVWLGLALAMLGGIALGVLLFDG